MHQTTNLKHYISQCTFQYAKRENPLHQLICTAGFLSEKYSTRKKQTTTLGYSKGGNIRNNSYTSKGLKGRSGRNQDLAKGIKCTNNSARIKVGASFEYRSASASPRDNQTAVVTMGGRSNFPQLCLIFNCHNKSSVQINCHSRYPTRLKK